MPSPKSGTAGNVVPAAAPEAVLEADDADPGKVAETKAEQSESSTSADSHQPDEEKTGWIEIEMKGEDDMPVAGEKYEVTLPDDSVAKGTLDGDGYAKIEGFDPGTCKVTFPDLDKEAWEKA